MITERIGLRTSAEMAAEFSLSIEHFEQLAQHFKVAPVESNGHKRWMRRHYNEISARLNSGDRPDLDIPDVRVIEVASVKTNVEGKDLLAVPKHAGLTSAMNDGTLRGTFRELIETASEDALKKYAEAILDLV